MQLDIISRNKATSIVAVYNYLQAKGVETVKFLGRLFMESRPIASMANFQM